MRPHPIDGSLRNVGARVVEVGPHVQVAVGVLVYLVSSGKKEFRTINTFWMMSCLCLLRWWLRCWFVWLALGKKCLDDNYFLDDVLLVPAGQSFGVVHAPFLDAILPPLLAWLLVVLASRYVVFAALYVTVLGGFVDTLCPAMVPMVRKGWLFLLFE